MVTEVLEERPGLQRVGTDLGRAYALTQLIGPVAVGDRVVLGSLPAEEAVVAALAAARVGAVVAYDDSAGAEGPVQVRSVDGAVVFTVDREDLPWDVAMRAGRTDPAPSADVSGDAILSRHGDDELSVLAALGASDDHNLPVPDGASVVEVGGLRLWSFDTP